MDYVVLCAGRGQRMMPLTKHQPKCMIKINGKSFIHHILDVIKEFDPDGRVIIITGYLQDVLYKHCRVKEGYKIYKHQPICNGTANAIYCVKDIVKDDFIVISGDTWISKEQLQLLKSTSNSLIYSIRIHNLESYGTLDINNNEIVRINEKETNPTTNLVNGGLYHFTQDIFKYIERTEYDKRFNEKIITNSINNLIRDGIKFYGLKVDELLEANTVKDIKKLEEHLNGK